MRRTRGCDTKSHNEVVGFHAIIFLLLHPFGYKQVQVEKNILNSNMYYSAYQIYSFTKGAQAHFNTCVNCCR